MSELASRYGLALFELASENQSSKQVYNDLNNMLNVLQDPLILSYFKARDVEKQEKIRVLENSFSNNNQEVFGLLKLLVKNHRFNIFSEIVNSYETIYYKKENIKIANVISATELDESNQEALIDALSKKYKSSIDLRVRVDKHLLSGLIIEVDKDVIDNSLKSKYEALKKNLLQGGKSHGY